MKNRSDFAADLRREQDYLGWVLANGREIYACAIADIFETFALMNEAPDDRVFEVGDGVTWSLGTDHFSGTVVEVRGSKVFVVEDKDKLLNGSESGEPDALQFSPGGFVGHTSGTQRYEFSPGDGAPIEFSRRKAMGGVFKKKGVSCSGSMRWHYVLSHGRYAHYDYNF